MNRPEGRTVRCANCGNSWHHLTPPPSPPARRRELPPSELPAMAGAPVVMAPRAAIIAAPSRQRRRSGLVWVFLILLVGAAIVALIVGRDTVVALWPATAQFYQLVGLKTGPPGAGLAIANVSSTRNADGLIVEGDITNKIGVACAVPHLRVALRDGTQRELTFKIVDPPRARLLPGETSHFTVGFLPAPDAAVGVVVTFAAG